MRIHVDFGLCQGHGVCKEEAPEVFDVDEREGRVIVLAAEPPESQRAAVERAVKYCPTRALKIEA